MEGLDESSDEAGEAALPGVWAALRAAEEEAARVLQDLRELHSQAPQPTPFGQY